MTALRLDRVALNVADLDRAAAFYAGALGFIAAGVSTMDRQLAGLLGVDSARSMLMRRGAQAIELTQTDPPGAPYPEERAANDDCFQHCALVTQDVHQAYARLGDFDTQPVSRGGPQNLPGGIVAYKFRDPDGHPLELISFPEPDQLTQGGIDHSAIVVADAGRSIAFYTDLLGLTVTARQVNTGPSQDALDGLDGTRVEVIALCPKQPAPHVELLDYRAPRGRVRPFSRWSDLAASRLVFVVDQFPDCLGPGSRDDTGRMCLRDPDGHGLLLDRQT